MADLSRRSFLRGALTVAAVAAAAPVLAKLPEPAAVKAPPAELYPILHGDGIHNDAPALNALFNGKPFICEGETITIGPNDCAYLAHGVYLVGEPLIISHPLVKIRDVTFKTPAEFIDWPVLTFNKSVGFPSISGTYFDIAAHPKEALKAPSARYPFASNYISRPMPAVGGHW